MEPSLFNKKPPVYYGHPVLVIVSAVLFYSLEEHVGRNIYSTVHFPTALTYTGEAPNNSRFHKKFNETKGKGNAFTKISKLHYTSITHHPGVKGPNS